MTRPIDLDDALSQWLANGPETVRDAVISAALDEVGHTPQRGAGFAPWRYLTMATTPIRRERAPMTTIVFAAAALLIAAALGTFVVLRPDIGIGEPAASRVFTEDDAAAIVGAPRALSGSLSELDLPPDYSSIDPLHLVLGNSDVTSETRAIEATLAQGIESRQLVMYDRLTEDGEVVGVDQPGGASLTVMAATYVDEAAADAAFGAFVDGYDTWGFAGGREAWEHGDEAVMYPYSLPVRSHGRCFINNPFDPCPQELRVWREGNLIVSVLQEGDSGVKAVEVVALIDDQLR